MPSNIFDYYFNLGIITFHAQIILYYARVTSQIIFHNVYELYWTINDTPWHTSIQATPNFKCNTGILMQFVYTLRYSYRILNIHIIEIIITGFSKLQRIIISYSLWYFDNKSNFIKFVTKDTDVRISKKFLVINVCVIFLKRIIYIIHIYWITMS